jgi:hypothetical protein
MLVFEGFKSGLMLVSFNFKLSFDVDILAFFARRLGDFLQSSGHI